MKPKKVELFETSGGATVKTVREWKESEISFLLGGLSEPMTTADVRDRILGHAEDLIAILQVRDTSAGRPKGAKDRQPRKPKQPAATTTESGAGQ